MVGKILKKKSTEQGGQKDQLTENELEKGFSRYFKEVFFKVSDQHAYGALLNWEIKIPHSGKKLLHVKR